MTFFSRFKETLPTNEASAQDARFAEGLMRTDHVPCVVVEYEGLDYKQLMRARIKPELIINRIPSREYLGRLQALLELVPSESISNDLMALEAAVYHLRHFRSKTELILLPLVKDNRFIIEDEDELYLVHQVNGAWALTRLYVSVKDLDVENLRRQVDISVLQAAYRNSLLKLPSTHYLCFYNASATETQSFNEHSAYLNTAYVQKHLTTPNAAFEIDMECLCELLFGVRIRGLASLKRMKDLHDRELCYVSLSEVSYDAFKAGIQRLRDQGLPKPPEVYTADAVTVMLRFLIDKTEYVYILSYRGLERALDALEQL